MKAETRYEIKQRLKRELKEIKQERKEIAEKQLVTSCLSDAFTKLCDRDTELSVKQFTARFQLGQLENGKPLLGHTMAADNNLTPNGNKPVN